MADVRITVVKRSLNKDLIDAYVPERSETAAPCSLFEDGQQFIVAGPFPSRPDGFCDWAWADIHRNVAMGCLGADLPPGCAFPSCTDGLRPVTFRIERIEE